MPTLYFYIYETIWKYVSFRSNDIFVMYCSPMSAVGSLSYKHLCCTVLTVIYKIIERSFFLLRNKIDKTSYFELWTFEIKSVGFSIMFHWNMHVQTRAFPVFSIKEEHLFRGAMFQIYFKIIFFCWCARLISERIKPRNAKTKGTGMLLTLSVQVAFQAIPSK